MSGKRWPLRSALQARVRLLSATLAPSTISAYNHTLRLFLGYMRQNHPGIAKPAQLTRDPHVLGWIEHLCTYQSRNTGKSLSRGARAEHMMRLRTLFDLLADLPHPPPAPLLTRADIPRREYTLPRPLPAGDDQRLRDWLGEQTDPLACALLLQRLTGMRIGELVDLEPNCLRHQGDNQWSLHVPHGKPRSERWVPVTDQARSLVERLAFLRTLPPEADPRFLLARPSGRQTLQQDLRARLRQAASQAGIEAHIVPHQLRHTYATSLLRAGVSLPALMRLLGHHNANMTMIYVEITQQDLQREFQAAQLRPRHLLPVPSRVLPIPLGPSHTAPTPSTAPDALRLAIELLQTPRPDDGSPQQQRSVVLIVRRLRRITALLAKLFADERGEK